MGNRESEIRNWKSEIRNRKGKSCQIERISMSIAKIVKISIPLPLVSYYTRISSEACNF